MNLGESQNAWLNAFRGIAALVVLAGHCRAWCLIPFEQLRQSNYFDKGVYFLTGKFGHLAVVVFFVLSGYLVGASAWRAAATGLWAQYAINRLTRLLVPLFPILLLTVLLDSAGSCLNPESYASEGVVWGSRVFWGNSIFLQKILVPVYGSNLPLWSLSYEFWYYVIFPLVALAFVSAGRRWLWALAALMVGGFVGNQILLYFSIWLLGFGAYFIQLKRPGPPGKIWLWVGGVAFLVFVLMYRFEFLRGFPGDFLIGCAFAAIIVGLRFMPPVGPRLEKLMHFLSETSYTVYLMHFPLLLFWRVVFFDGVRAMPGMASYLRLAGLSLGVYGCCLTVWWLFERNTGKVRAFLLNWMGSR